jgi:Tol biopolymer transport system component
LTQITSAGPDFDPAWSPDGKRIAFTSTRDGNNEIYLMNADGSTQTRLTNNAAIDIDPKWSPDGRILFNSTRDVQGDIYVMDDNGANVTRLTVFHAGHPDWSRDGSKIAFMGLPSSDRHPQIYIADADGRNITHVVTTPRPTAEPCWSPTGQIVFTTIVDKLGVRINIFQVDSDGRNLKRLTAGPLADERPSLSPDGSKLAFHSNRDGNYEIYVKSLR